MDINTVKDLGDCYLVNSLITVPKYVTNNKDHREIQEWLSIEGNSITPQFTNNELIDNLKDEKHKQRKQLRDSEKYATTIDCLGSTYKSDMESMTALSFSRGGMNRRTNIDWWDNNDVKVSLTFDNVKEIINAVRTRGLEATDKSKTIKAEINAINDITELSNYDVQTRWNEL